MLNDTERRIPFGGMEVDSIGKIRLVWTCAQQKEERHFVRMDLQLEGKWSRERPKRRWTERASLCMYKGDTYTKDGKEWRQAI